MIKEKECEKCPYLDLCNGDEEKAKGLHAIGRAIEYLDDMIRTGGLAGLYDKTTAAAVMIAMGSVVAGDAVEEGAADLDTIQNAVNLILERDMMVDVTKYFKVQLSE